MIRKCLNFVYEVKRRFVNASCRVLSLAFTVLIFGAEAIGEGSVEEKELLRDFGDLGECVLISVDENVADDGVELRRYILDSELLGRLLLVEESEGTEIRRRSLYSAERLVVNVAQRADLQTVRRSLIEIGMDCQHPFTYSSFLYVKPASSVETAEELYGLAQRARAAVGAEHVVEYDPIAFRTGLEPNDPLYARQWHHEELQMSEAWTITTGDPSIVVAVVDGGVFPNLEEFEGRLVEGVNLNFEAGVEDNPEPHDDVGHGTAVTGLLAANANNGKLGSGVDWQCKIMPVRATQNNAASGTPIAAGIDYAVAHGARVINVSWGASESQLLRASVKNAADNGAVVVAGLGNRGLDAESIPAKADEAIAVGATIRNGTRAIWSNWGEGIDLVAPGEDLYTVGEKGVELVVGGTSGSTPLVAGAASLLLSVNPDLDWRGIRDLLAAGAIDQTGDPLDTPGWDEYYGWGRLNVLNSLLLAKVQLNIEYDGVNRIRLSWRVPSNLDERVSYHVERSVDMLEWERIPSLVIAIEETEGKFMAKTAFRTESNASARLFYRVAVDLHIEGS